ncbi:MAG: PAS domain S-box protein [Nitrospirota bacterium]
MKIRRKLLRNFFALIIPFITIFGAITIHEINFAVKNLNRLNFVSRDIYRSYDLQIVLDRAIMPGNDYIITGDKRYIDDFHRVSRDVERILKDVEETHLKDGNDTIHKKEEIEILNEFRVTWQNIKMISLKIFSIPKPVGNKRASVLMEEMDYKWRYPLNEKFGRLMEIHMKGYRDAFSQHHSAMRLGFIILAIASAVLLIGGVSITLLYSLRLNKILVTIHKGAEKIAEGDFKTRLDIKTGDEFEGISNAMNEMAAQLDNFYATLEQRIEERTRELQESEERFRAVGVTAPNAIICLEAPDTITFWNIRAAEIFGYSEEEVAGKSMHALIVPERYREKAREGMKNFFQTGTGPIAGKKTELFALRRDGTEFPVELSLSAMNIGGNWQATGIVRDITEHKKAEEKLRQRIDELEQFRKVTIKRELRMEELKKRVEELEKKLGSAE